MGSIAGWVVGIASSVASALGLAAYGRARWAEATHRLLGLLEATRLPPTVTHYDVIELEGLPSPVQRYFRAVLKDGQQMITAMRVQHSGFFNLSPTGERWKPFTSQQRVVTRRPGFLWNASIDVVPGLAMRVHDAYVGGEGRLHVAALGLFPVADLQGPGDVAQGELMRFLAEAAWYPTALLPSQGVRWAAVDDRSANATLVDGSISVTMLFRFDEAGLIESARAEARGAAVGKTVVMKPWEVRLSNYQQREGMRVPLDGEAAWLEPRQRKPYFRGTMVLLAYEFAA
jgi:hypothetical protein